LIPTAVDLQGQGRDNADLRVRISYKSHVFSKSIDAWDADFDFRDELGRKRLFCPNRYAISQTLPGVCRNMLATNAVTWISKDKRENNNLAVINGRLIDGAHDLIIYHLFPSSVDGIDVEMVVKSAYNKNLKIGSIKRKFKMIQQVRTCHFNDKNVP
jgi:hypothetical protein